MAEKINVPFNGRIIVLEKSDEFMGVKPPKTTDRGLTPAFANQRKVYTRLGGFEIYKIEKGKSTERSLDAVRSTTNLVGTHIYQQTSNQKLFVPTGEIQINFIECTELSEQKKVLDQYSLKLVQQIDEDSVIVKTTALSPNPIKTALLLNNESLVDTAEPDLDSQPELYAIPTPPSALFHRQWHIKNTGAGLEDFPGDGEFKAAQYFQTLRPGRDSKIWDAWNELGNTGSPNIILAVNDRGTDISHPDFAGRNLITYDFFTKAPLTNPDRDTAHGTSCAGLAGGTIKGNGVVGVAPTCKLAVLEHNYLSWDFFRSMADYCINNKVDVLSLSWGVTLDDNYYPINENIARELTRITTLGRGGKGCVVLVAAGNEGYDRVNFLGTHPNLICVGASTSRDMQASYSNIGTHLSVVAPGGPQPIIAANASWGDQRYDNYILHDAGFAQYTYFEGTSAATPIAAGVCALILSANPNLTAAQVKEILQKSADKVGYPSEYTSGHSVRYGYGRVNALRAVKLAKSTVGAGSVDTSSPNPPVTPPKPIPVVNPPQPPPNSDQRAIVNSPDGLLNVRARPDSSAPLVKTLKNGAVVSVKGVSEDGKWCRIDIGQFVARRFLKF